MRATKIPQLPDFQAQSARQPNADHVVVDAVIPVRMQMVAVRMQCIRCGQQFPDSLQHAAPPTF
jgi:hypothetical protein